MNLSLIFAFGFWLFLYFWHLAFGFASVARRTGGLARLLHAVDRGVPGYSPLPLASLVY